MPARFSGLLAILCQSLSLLAWGAQGVPQGEEGSVDNSQAQKLPSEAILVRGARSSASDAVTPVPEGGRIVGNVYSNRYFGLTYALPSDWTESYSGPPPSDSGFYVLAQIEPVDSLIGSTRGSILIAAEDLFFTLTPARNALEFINYRKEKLSAEYEVEQPPGLVILGGHTFVRFGYVSPMAGLHWYVLAAEIRCHVLQFVFTAHDTKSMQRLAQELDRLKLASGVGPTLGKDGGNVPVCLKDYANGENLLHRVDPVLTERRFNAVPVRIIIDKQGKVEHVHFLSAFPDQAKAISDALLQWRFKPYLEDGHPVEVETGITFGRTPRPGALSGR